MRTRGHTILALTLALFIGCVNAVVYKFNNQDFPTGQYYLLRTGLITVDDAPMFFGKREEPYVKFDITKIDMKNGQGKEVIDIAVFHSDDLPFIGSHLTSNLKDQFYLCVNGTFFVDENSEDMYRDKITTPDGTNDKYFVTKSGIYYLIMINCDTSSEATMVLDGRITFKNPYGQLDAEEFGFLPFFGMSTVAYLLIGLVWGAFNLWYLKDLLKLQLFITGVFLLSLLESAFFYFHYQTINASGSRSPFIFTVATTISLGRRTVSRLLVLVVCMGYSIIKEQLGQKSFVIAVYGFTYFTVTCISEIVNILYYKMHVLSPLVASLLSLPGLVVDALYYVWVLYELRNILRQLGVRKQAEKLVLYNRFKWLLILYVVCSMVWTVYENFLQLQGRREHDKRWETNWTTSAFWHMLYFVILVLTMILWNPRSNNKRYAFSQGFQAVATEDADEDERENLVEMNSIPINDASDDEEEERTKKQKVEKITSSKSGGDKKKKKNKLSGFSIDDNEDDEDIVDKID